MISLHRYYDFVHVCYELQQAQHGGGWWHGYVFNTYIYTVYFKIHDELHIAHKMVHNIDQWLFDIYTRKSPGKHGITTCIKNPM